MSNKDWTPYLRDFKLGIITGAREINPCQESLKRFDEQLTFIKDEFPNDIITGSLGLNISFWYCFLLYIKIILLPLYYEIYKF